MSIATWPTCISRLNGQLILLNLLKSERPYDDDAVFENSLKNHLPAHQASHQGLAYFEPAERSANVFDAVDIGSNPISPNNAY